MAIIQIEAKQAELQLRAEGMKINVCHRQWSPYQYLNIDKEFIDHPPKATANKPFSALFDATSVRTAWGVDCSGHNTQFRAGTHSIYDKKVAKSSRAHSSDVRKTELTLGKTKRQDITSGHQEGCEGLTHRCYKSKVLQHHITEQESLSLIKEPPLLLGELPLHGFTPRRALPCNPLPHPSPRFSEAGSTSAFPSRTPGLGLQAPGSLRAAAAIRLRGGAGPEAAGEERPGHGGPCPGLGAGPLGGDAKPQTRPLQLGQRLLGPVTSAATQSREASIRPNQTHGNRSNHQKRDAGSPAQTASQSRNAALLLFHWSNAAVLGRSGLWVPSPQAPPNTRKPPSARTERTETAVTLRKGTPEVTPVKLPRHGNVPVLLFHWSNAAVLQCSVFWVM
ncbi:hypothetical protein HPG69_008326 [Diceros bicornis minor]|uniref:Uncharacterized protein n=1 Tax=Diceros bicornis minor TaxID=77932 RepID=A0A7J7F088_DICBM|nr:hypothetical protein HPG69_008326 [Diceros bicornis minor]